jgi:hypothetical protein
MKYKKINKKAQIDSTLVWFFAIFIIMFILIIFITISFLMADQKSLFGNSVANENSLGTLNDAGVTESFFSLVNSNIEYNGKSERIMDAVLNSSYEFLNESSINGMGSVQVKQINEKNKGLALIISERGKAFCPVFYLMTPFGLINQDSFFTGNVMMANSYSIPKTSKSLNIPTVSYDRSTNTPAFSYDDSEFSPTVSYSINYSGKDIQIEFKQLKNCSGAGKLGGQKNGA